MLTPYLGSLKSSVCAGELCGSLRPVTGCRFMHRCRKSLSAWLAGYRAISAAWAFLGIIAAGSLHWQTRKPQSAGRLYTALRPRPSVVLMIVLLCRVAT